MFKPVLKSASSPDGCGRAIDRNVDSILQGADGANQTAPFDPPVGLSEVSMTGTPTTVSDPVSSDSAASAALTGATDLGFQDGLAHAIDSILASGADAEEITIDWVPAQTAVVTGAMTNTLGIAVDNHRQGHPQEDRHYASSFPALSAEHAIEFLTKTIAKIDAQTRDYQSGSTLTSVVVTQDGNLVSAHLGDSPASAIAIGPDGALKWVLQVTKDHKPTNEDKIREAADGTVFVDSEERRWVAGVGSINMTHALGDSIFGAAISHQPELKSHRLQHLLSPGDRLFLLVTSDGAHNQKKGITHLAHAETLCKGLQRELSLDHIARQIAVRSKDIKDNVTVVLLEVEVGKGAVAGVFDGHGGSETSQRAFELFKTSVAEFS